LIKFFRNVGNGLFFDSTFSSPAKLFLAQNVVPLKKEKKREKDCGRNDKEAIDWLRWGFESHPLHQYK
jgi:hypothetical protein